MTVESTLILYMSLRDLPPVPAHIFCRDPERSSHLLMPGPGMCDPEKGTFSTPSGSVSRAGGHQRPWETFDVRKPVSCKHFGETRVSTQGCSFSNLTRTRSSFSLLQLPGAPLPSTFRFLSHVGLKRRHLSLAHWGGWGRSPGSLQSPGHWTRRHPGPASSAHLP